MVWVYVAGLLLLVVLTILWISPKKPSKNFPPGPFSWPFVGNFPQLGKEPHNAIAQMRDKYGDIIGLQLGSYSAIVMHDVQMIKEAFSKPEFSARPPTFHFADDTRTNRGVIFTSGAIWEEQRRFLFKNLGDFGFGKKNSLEGLMVNEVSTIIERFEQTLGTTVNTDQMFYVSVGNVLWTIVSGESLSYDDPKIDTLISHWIGYAKNPKALGTLLYFPGLSTLFPNISGFNGFVKDITKVYDFIKQGIAEHREDFQEGVNRDLIDCYLEKLRKTNDPNSSFYKDIGERNMVHALHDAFLASMDAVSTSLTWLLFYLAHYPEVQEKLHQSIIEIVGHETRPYLEHRKSMVFVEAVVLETLRSSSLFSMGLVHEVTTTVEFHGYTLPKGTLAFANQHWVLHNPRIWGDPNNFRPERFIQDNGKVDSRNEAFIPFSTGKRVCPGQSFARDQLFLYTANLYQNFKIEFNPSAPKPPLHSPSKTPLLSPSSFDVVFSKRS